MARLQQEATSPWSSDKRRRDPAPTSPMDRGRRRTARGTQTSDIRYTGIKAPRPEQKILSQNRLELQCTRRRAIIGRMLTDEEEAALNRELNGGACKFEKTIGGLRMRPIAFISQRRPTPSSRHSFVGEASTGQWAMLKFKRFLIGQEFTWITDCSGLVKFFEMDYEATHTIQ
jgi:hypothetical protein